SDLGDFIEDADAVVPIEAAAFILLQDQLEEILGTLSEREQRIIQLRFGLTDGHPRTLEEVGREFGVTRERIRQIEAKTLAKLRHPSRAQMLREYLDRGLAPALRAESGRDTGRDRPPGRAAGRAVTAAAARTCTGGSSSAGTAPSMKKAGRRRRRRG